jgi:hypothetical protein
MLFTSWDQESGYEESLEILSKIGNELCPEEFRKRFPSFPWGSISDLLNYRFEYSTLNAEDAYLLRQYQALYSKFEPLRIEGVDRELKAWNSFLESEAQCKISNAAFKSNRLNLFSFGSDVESVFHRAQRKISQIMGNVPSFEDLKPRLGPGASTSTKRMNASWARKFSAPLACSRAAVPYLSEMLHTLPHLLPFGEDEGVVSVDIHPGKLQFVPKSALTYRSIVVEPQLNSMYQLGVCDFLADKLRRAGVDISDQTLNQRLAREGSLTNELATLDLSSASDTISIELVASLLPVDWFIFLSSLRSSEVTYKGQTIKLEKFSSMGNGFTFPLETIIFYSLAFACCETGEVVSCYGDDLIVPSNRYPLLCKVLTSAGFSVNMKKSYVEGPFRESCGKDYLLGTDIRPFFFKELVSCRTIFSFHNFLVSRGFDPTFLLEYIAEHVRLYGPEGYGDGHLVGEWPGRTYNRDRGWAGYVFDSYSFKPRLDTSQCSGYRVLPSYSIYVKSMDSEALPVKYGRPCCTLPGTQGYRRLSIYTLVVPSYIS